MSGVDLFLKAWIKLPKTLTRVAFLVKMSIEARASERLSG